jgi:uncharacterized protein DUF6152
MRIQSTAFVAAVMTCLLESISLLAHHSFAAEFDASKPLKLRGTVMKVEWINPHIFMYIDVKNPDGTVTNWAVEGAAPNAMFRRGVRKDTLPAGVEVTVEGFQAKNGKPVANGRTIAWPGGMKLYMGSSGTGAPDDPKKEKEK